MQNFNESGVLVTGGGSGIGRAAAHAFAARGARVLVVGRTKQALAEIAEAYPTIEILPMDVTEPDAPAGLRAAVNERLGRLDVLVNNAAVIRPAPFGDLGDDAIEVQLRTNLIAPIRLTQALLPELERQRGVVVNVSTALVSTDRGWIGSSLYGAAKAGLDFLTRTWAVELAGKGVRVVGVAPGVIDTQVLENGGTPPERAEETRAGLVSQIPLGRLGRPEEVAHWIVALCLPEASYATGATLRLDGGLAIA